MNVDSSLPLQGIEDQSAGDVFLQSHAGRDRRDDAHQRDRSHVPPFHVANLADLHCMNRGMMMGCRKARVKATMYSFQAPIRLSTNAEDDDEAIGKEREHGYPKDNHWLYGMSNMAPRDTQTNINTSSG